jgi:ParB-like chromosome segregation protein Spo0J
MSQDIKEATLQYDRLEGFTADPIANENPMLSEEKLKILQDDIAANGQLNPVVIFKDKIIDGRNRLAAIRNLKKDLKVVYVNSSYEDAVSLAKSYNDKRRHMSKSQFAMRAAYAIIKSREDTNQKKISVDNVSEVAESLVSKRHVESALKLVNNNAELANKVFMGELDLSDALRSVGVAAKQPSSKSEIETYLTKTYSATAAEEYKKYLKKGKYSKETLAKELVEAKMQIENLKRSI